MRRTIPKSVKLVEVGPRDGLQNEKTIIDTKDKFTFIKMLAEAGLTTIEATSFVNPAKIPQMSDAKELYKMLASDKSLKDVLLPCLVPNMKGLEAALEVGVKEIAMFTATSNTFNKKNINATIDESFERFKPVAEKAMQNGVKIRGYISTVFGCPYEGDTSLDSLKKVAEKYLDYGCYEISLGDTIGIAHPSQVINIITELKKDFDLNIFAMHFHDTRGMALANALVSLEEGIHIFDSSAGGLGGCPYAKGATGNVGTEDMIYLLNSMGIETNVDMAKLVKASEFLLSKIGCRSQSRYHNAYIATGK